MADVEGPTLTALSESKKHSALEAIDDAKDAMKSLTDKVVGSSKEYLHKAKGNVEDLTHKVKDSSKDYLEKAKGNVEDLTHKVKDSSKDYLEKAKGSIEDLTQKTKDSSKVYLDKVKESIEDRSNKVSKTAKTSDQVKLKEKTQREEGSSNDQSSENNEVLSFPLNILTWCSTLCTKTSSGVEQTSRNFDVSNIINETADHTMTTVEQGVQTILEASLPNSTNALETNADESTEHEVVDHQVTSFATPVETLNNGKQILAVEQSVETILEESLPNSTKALETHADETKEPDAVEHDTVATDAAKQGVENVLETPLLEYNS